MSLATPTVKVPLYAGFWRRAAAAFVDSLVLAIPNIGINIALKDSPLGFVAQLVVAVLYFGMMHASATQATLGKQALGIKVTGLDGERIGIGRALGRYFAFLLSSILLCIGLLMAAFTGRKQALHDFICGTLVVNDEAAPEEVVAGGGTMPLTAGVWVAIVFLLLVPVTGMLAAIAIPAYHDYTVRAKVMQVVGASVPIRRDVEAAVQEKRAWNVGPAPVTTRYASAAEVTREGHVVVALADDVYANGRIRWIPREASGTVQWTCRGEDVPPKYLPANCRGGG